MSVFHVQLHVSSGSKFQTISNFKELHAFTQATHSYVLLTYVAEIECYWMLAEFKVVYHWASTKGRARTLFILLQDMCEPRL